MVCDIIAASKTYNGDKFENTMPYDHFIKKMKKTTLIHKATIEFVTLLLKNYAYHGNKALNPSFTKHIYAKINEKYSKNQK